MRKLKKAFVYALIVTVVINGFGFLAAVNNSGLDSTITDFKRMSRMTIALFFVPTFLSILFYKKDVFKKGFKGIEHFIIPALISFVAVYVIIHFSMIPYAKTSYNGISRLALNNALFSIFLFLFITIIIYITKIKTKSKKIKKLNINSLIALIIIIIITIFILIGIPLISNNPFTYAEGQLKRELIYRLITSIITCLSFFYIYRDFFKSKKIIAIMMVYFVNLILFPIAFMGFEFFKTAFLFSLALCMPFALILTVAIHTYFIYLINKQEKINLKQIGVEASLKYQQLKSQISPHFLFNNISVLTGLIEENQEKAVQFSEDLSKVYRYFLEQETQDLVTLKDEISFANKYLALLKVRFEDALLFNNDLEETGAFYILPMTLQQVFENVVKHNELSVENPIVIAMSIEKDFLVISNTLLPKLPTETKNPTGLENIKNRYTYFTDEKVIINKDDNLFTIKLPLLKPEA
ncbi:sensor histidine kinase [Lacinutrix jangbogonensis]|uniref:sensor histidine kinase n=1 Tax=Lacinutrix jangbogonensis TaxID=1469557 RepID=UPI00068E227F|nr:sensor histidine kinase [Lacinutrix jangbogonensis]